MTWAKELSGLYSYSGSLRRTQGSAFSKGPCSYFLAPSWVSCCILLTVFLLPPPLICDDCGPNQVIGPTHLQVSRMAIYITFADWIPLCQGTSCCYNFQRLEPIPLQNMILSTSSIWLHGIILRIQQDNERNVLVPEPGTSRLAIIINILISKTDLTSDNKHVRWLKGLKTLKSGGSWKWTLLVIEYESSVQRYMIWLFIFLSKTGLFPNKISIYLSLYN